jgi:membrane-associated phospholipid phosphatase
MSTWLRMAHMGLGWGCVSVVYFATGVLPAASTVLPETWLDRIIPFNPSAIWPYLSFYILIPVAYLATDAARLGWLTRSMQFCAVFAGTIFLLWPTTLQYPAAPGSGLEETWLRYLMAVDTNRNCLPSLHGALTLLCVWALLDAKRPLRSCIAIIGGAWICYSIIQLRRHLSIDLGAGLLSGYICGRICTHPAILPFTLVGRIK